MFQCPICRASSRTRSSDHMSNTTQRAYHQCNNILCSTTFCTMTEVSHIVSRGKKEEGIPPVSMDVFPPSNRGRQPHEPEQKSGHDSVARTDRRGS